MSANSLSSSNSSCNLSFIFEKFLFVIFLYSINLWTILLWVNVITFDASLAFCLRKLIASWYTTAFKFCVVFLFFFFSYCNFFTRLPIIVISSSIYLDFSWSINSLSNELKLIIDCWRCLRLYFDFCWLRVDKVEILDAEALESI